MVNSPLPLSWNKFEKGLVLIRKQSKLIDLKNQNLYLARLDYVSIEKSKQMLMGQMISLKSGLVVCLSKLKA